MRVHFCPTFFYIIDSNPKTKSLQRWRTYVLPAAYRGDGDRICLPPNACCFAFFKARGQLRDLGSCFISFCDFNLKQTRKISSVEALIQSCRRCVNEERNAIYIQIRFSRIERSCCSSFRSVCHDILQL